MADASLIIIIIITFEFRWASCFVSANKNVNCVHIYGIYISMHTFGVFKSTTFTPTTRWWRQRLKRCQRNIVTIYVIIQTSCAFFFSFFFFYVKILLNMPHTYNILLKFYDKRMLISLHLCSTVLCDPYVRRLLHGFQLNQRTYNM